MAPKIRDLTNKDVKGYTCPSGSPQYGLQSWDYDNDAEPLEDFKILSDGKLTVSTLLWESRHLVLLMWPSVPAGGI